MSVKKSLNKSLNQTIWGAWAGDEIFELIMPSNWDVDFCKIKDSKRLSDDDIRKKVLESIGCESLRNIARGKQNVAIVVEDITRPLKLERVVNRVLNEILTAGIKQENIFHFFVV